MLNTNINSYNQSAYVRYARRLRESNYAFPGDRNRMPLYPALQSLLYREDMPDETLFLRGKYANVGLSIVLLLAITALLVRILPRAHVLNLGLVLAFFVFLFKAPYFQSELLFYFLNLCSFLLMCGLLRQPDWRRAVLTGTVLGLGHLTKASVLPGLVLFAAASLLKAAHGLWQRRRVAVKSDDASLPARLAGGAFLVVLVFLGVIYPYLRTSKRLFGRYFYNVNSTFYMWYDSWEEVTQGTRAHGDRKGWPDMPDALLPSPQRYLREHTVSQMARRIWDGLRHLEERSRQSFGYHKYAVIYGVLALAVLVAERRKVLRVARANLFLLLFVLSFFGCYLVLYAWYTPIGRGDRFILAQFMPFMVSLSAVICSGPARDLAVVVWGKKLGWIAVVNGLLAVVIAIDIYFVLTVKGLTMSGGN